MEPGRRRFRPQSTRNTWASRNPDTPLETNTTLSFLESHDNSVDAVMLAAAVFISLDLLLSIIRARRPFHHAEGSIALGTLVIFDVLVFNNDREIDLRDCAAVASVKSVRPSLAPLIQPVTSDHRIRRGESDVLNERAQPVAGLEEDVTRGSARMELLQKLKSEPRSEPTEPMGSSRTRCRAPLLKRHTNARNTVEREFPRHT